MWNPNHRFIYLLVKEKKKTFEILEFDENVHSMEDLKIGMSLNGMVTNVTNFGAFVDIGVHQDGLVHKSHLADRFVNNPADFIKVQQNVKATIIGVDIPRKRISLSLKSDPFGEKPRVKKAERPNKKSDNSLENKLTQLRNRFK